jgi:hypothetical protein
MSWPRQDQRTSEILDNFIRVFVVSLMTLSVDETKNCD